MHNKIAFLAALALSLITVASARAQNVCKHGGKKYTISATRCENGDRLRCVKANTWKRIAACKADKSY